jgi:hypothetical protein
MLSFSITFFDRAIIAANSHMLVDGVTIICDFGGTPRSIIHNQATSVARSITI